MGATEHALAVTKQKDALTGFETSNTGADPASAAIAAQAQAMVQSRYVMAMRNPRNMDQVRQDLIAECERPAFANNPSAFYIKPIGDGVEGLGIRFVEVALRCMKNVLVETKMIYENSEIEVHNISVTDLESNVTYPMDVKVSKTVERKKAAEGTFISVRKNSYGQNVFTVQATDDELLNKRAALISKAIRTLGLRIIPGDLQDEAETIIKRVRQDEAAADPAAGRKKVVDAFAKVGVKASDLVEYLGHDLAQCTPAQVSDLKALLGALREGEATWQGIMNNKAEREASTKTEAKPEAKKGAVEKAKEASKPASEVKPEEPAAASQPAAETKPPAETEAEEGAPPATGNMFE